MTLAWLSELLKSKAGSLLVENSPSDLWRHDKSNAGSLGYALPTLPEVIDNQPRSTDANYRTPVTFGSPLELDQTGPANSTVKTIKDCNDGVGNSREVHLPHSAKRFEST
jgi:hypothetical protein